MSLCVEKVCNSGFDSAVTGMPLIYMFKRVVGHTVKRELYNDKGNSNCYEFKHW